MRNLDTRATVTGTNCHCWDENLAGQHLQKQQVDRKKRPSPFSRLMVYWQSPVGIWMAKEMRFSESLPQCLKAKPRRVSLEIRDNSLKISTTCFVHWSLTFYWSLWLLTPKFDSCLQSCLHARTLYLVAFMQLWSLGFSPWLAFAVFKTLWAASHRRPSWPSSEAFV